MNRDYSTPQGRRGQSTVEWLLVIAIVALLVHAATSRTGTQVERLFRVSAERIGVEFPDETASEVVASTADEGGIAASGRSVRASKAKQQSASFGMSGE